MRFPHLLWKRGFNCNCTTELVPGTEGGFSRGATGWQSYTKLVQVCAPAVVMNSEILHRGGTVPAALGGWASSCSLELCSAAGWEAWCVGTEGTVADPDDEEYRMLLIAPEK